MRIGWIINTVFGLALAIGGAWVLVYLIQHPPIQQGLAYAMLVVAILGGLLINPTPNNPAPLLTVIKSLVVVVSPIIPWSKAGQAARLSGAVTPPPVRKDDLPDTRPPGAGI